MSKIMSPLYGPLRSLILPIKQIDTNLPKSGKIIDLGCGQGVISTYLARLPKRQILGVDSNKKRLPKTNIKNLKFIRANITKYKLGKANGIIISDVLHHIVFEDQKNLLTRIGRALRPDGTLVIKEIDKSEFIRSTASRFWDFLLYPQDKINYWKALDLKIFLQNLGFIVKIQKASRLFPGSTTLFICKKS